MYGVTKIIHFSYGHRLIRNAGKCARYHGHNAVAEITCECGELDENNMVVDFDRLVELLGGWIDDHLDHRMILNRQDELIPFLKARKEPFVSVEGEPTAEVISKLIYDQALSSGLPVREVKIWETPSSSASYRG